MTKAELRKNFLAQQRSLGREERLAASNAIADTFFRSFDLTNIEYLHCFIPIAKFNEIETLRIIGRVWKEFPSTQVVVPRVDFAAMEMSSLKFKPDTELASNSWDISEPTHDEIVDGDEIDMVLVPGLCFDRSGHRVGYGKGFYDRFLTTCRDDCVKVGLTYWDPVEKIDDVHAGDMQVDFVVTPKNVVGLKKLPSF